MTARHPAERGAALRSRYGRHRRAAAARKVGRPIDDRDDFHIGPLFRSQPFGWAGSRAIAARGIPLAICPTSNLRLGVVRSLDDHPLRELWASGVRVSVNTDDPGFFGCDLVGEYAIAGRLLALDRAGYARLALNSVESTFAPEQDKADLRRAIADWLDV